MRAELTLSTILSNKQSLQSVLYDGISFATVGKRAVGLGVGIGGADFVPVINTFAEPGVGTIGRKCYLRCALGKEMFTVFNIEILVFNDQRSHDFFFFFL